jgi:leader peptidase (prepilin peptidase)/N-methyltransferase
VTDQAGGLDALTLAASGGLALALLAIAAIDLRRLRIPDALSLPLAAAGLGLALLRPLQPFADHLAGAAGGFLLLAGIGAWHFRRTGREGLGLGDAKLFAAAGAWLGWQALPAVLLVAALAGLAAALSRPAPRRRDRLAFGPWLALAFWAVWCWRLAAG